MLILTFIIGYIAIILEVTLKLSKSATALLTSVACWTIFVFSNAADTEGGNHGLSEVLSKTSEIIFFLLGAMTIVELMDAHNGFSLVTNRINATNNRRLLWIIALITFILAAILDTLATIVVVVKLVDKLVKDEKTKLLLIGFAVIAANAGGSWSVIGAPTTTMLWIGKQVSVGSAFWYLFLPCFLSLIATLGLFQFKFSKEKIVGTDKIEEEPLAKSEKLIFYIGIAALLFVPVFKTITHLPPYLGMMLSLALVWIVSETIHSDKDEAYRETRSVGYVLSKIDTPSILFFLGILLAVGCLEKAGVLAQLATDLEQILPNKTMTITFIGLLSAIVDNIPLTAAAMGMYPISNFPTDHNLWLLTAYCVGTGGSILIIGSAAGVAAMGMNKAMSFFWYLKNMAGWAALAYFIGIGLFLLLKGFA